MFKKLFYLSFVFLIFSFFSSSVFAWNSMCHSPVQMAALMSKPKNKKPSTKKLRRQIIGIEKKMDKMDEALDDLETSLGDSLDGNKLGEDPADVANQIRDYIESQQDGWDCDSSTGQSFLFQSPKLFEILGSVFIPSAFADGVLEVEAPNRPNLATQGFADLTETPGNPLIPSDDVPKSRPADLFTPSNSKKGDLEVTQDNPNLATQGFADLTETPALEDNPRKTICNKSRGRWEDGKCICPKGRKLKGNGKCVAVRRGLSGTSNNLRKTICNKSGGTWKNGKCVKKPTVQAEPDVSGTSDNPLIPSDDVPKTSPAVPSNSKKGGLDVETDLPNSATLSFEDLIETPTSEEEEKSCKAKGRIWNAGRKECCSNGKGLKGSTCVSMTNCLVSGGALNSTPGANYGACFCDTRRGLKREGDKCVAITCPKNQKLINGRCVSTSKCPVGEERVNGRCMPKCPKGQKLKEDKCMPVSGQKVKPSKPKKPTIQAEPEEQDPRDLQTVVPTPFEIADEPSPLNSDDTAEPCPKWKHTNLLNENGKVKSSFCDDYAGDKKRCKRALNRIGKLVKGIAKLEDRKETIEDELFDAKSSLHKNANSKTEAGGLCFDCLKRVLNSSRPTAGENIGNALKMITGVGMAGMGYNIGKRAQTDANMLRIRQGYEAQNDNYAFTGAANLGFPFMAQGLYGLTRTNTPTGGWSCSPTVSPYGRSYNYQMGQGFNMRYY